MDSPKLIENSIKNYLFTTLQKCHSNRITIYYYALNAGVLILFLGIVGLVLYYCNKNKLSDYEKGQRMLKDQEYVLSKIRYYKQDVKNTTDSAHSSITNLPFVNE